MNFRPPAILVCKIAGLARLSFVEKENNEFKILAEFLERFAPEVVGHCADEPPPEMRERLDRFIAGQCNEAEIEAVCVVLRTRPEWTNWVSGRVKSQRSADADGSR